MEVQLFERMAQIRQMETNVCSLAEGQIYHLSEGHLTELRERDARIAQRDAEVVHAQRMVEEARVAIVASTTPSELYEQRQQFRAEYEQSLAEMSHVQEERDRVHSALKTVNRLRHAI